MASNFFFISMVSNTCQDTVQACAWKQTKPSKFPQVEANNTVHMSEAKRAGMVTIVQNYVSRMINIPEGNAC